MGWLLDRDALAVPRLGTLNVHPALLPAYRGPEPTFWQLFDAVAESGVTVHRVEPGRIAGRSCGSSASRCRRARVWRSLSPGRWWSAAAAARRRRRHARRPGSARGAARRKPHAASRPPARRGCQADRLAELGLDRAWRVLSGAGPLLDCPPARWRDLGWIASVVGMSPGSARSRSRQAGSGRGGELPGPSARLSAPALSVGAPCLVVRPAPPRRAGAGLIAAETAAAPPLERLLRSYRAEGGRAA